MELIEVFARFECVNLWYLIGLQKEEAVSCRSDITSCEKYR